METYGRWGKDCLTLIRALTRYKAKNFPVYLQRSIECSCYSRWWNLLSISVQRIIYESVIRENGSDLLDAAQTLSTPPVEELMNYAR